MAEAYGYRTVDVVCVAAAAQTVVNDKNPVQHFQNQAKELTIAISELKSQSSDIKHRMPKFQNLVTTNLVTTINCLVIELSKKCFCNFLVEEAALSTQIKENSLSEAVTAHAESGAATTNTKDDNLSVTSRDNDFVYTLSFAEHTYDSTRTQKKGFHDTQTENTTYSTRTTDEDFAEIQSGKANQNASEQKKSMHIYHTIDDNILGGQSTNCYASSEVMIESSSQKGKHIGPAYCYTQHPQQYQSLVPSTLEMHHYK
ncbi:unnamed protein product [Mytilus coruscus]|uniref:Uncharacterized protein n=1 Tax=Mytilus coruscus TaxID=42192 RepID=A0A6J8ACH0_MYTCO|nr:unnamed protein product [Mytilus coruscus]